MSSPVINGEKVRLSLALDRFTAQVMKRLHEKADEGYEGWDGDRYMSLIANDLHADASNLANYLDEGDEPDENWTIDIAARAMMLWWTGWGHKLVEEAQPIRMAVPE